MLERIYEEDDIICFHPHFFVIIDWFLGFRVIAEKCSKTAQICQII